MSAAYLLALLAVAFRTSSSSRMLIRRGTQVLHNAQRTIEYGRRTIRSTTPVTPDRVCQHCVGNTDIRSPLPLDATNGSSYVGRFR